PEILMRRELGKHDVTRLEVVSDMATRKERMVELSDAFIALPGGLGTLDELFEVMTLRQLGLHRKPVGLLNHEGYFEGLLAMCSGFVGAGFVHPGDLDHLIVEQEVETLLERIAR
ncbi:MAG: TIGR00730 family Rossman fold protein, partial [Burkholderiaceae bacterium]|nr:TIGR00730 family Rossman fold protein [Burkholderiaceae bacterium]